MCVCTSSLLRMRERAPTAAASQRVGGLGAWRAYFHVSDQPQVFSDRYILTMHSLCVRWRPLQVRPSVRTRTSPFEHRAGNPCRDCSKLPLIRSGRGRAQGVRGQSNVSCCLNFPTERTQSGFQWVRRHFAAVGFSPACRFFSACCSAWGRHCAGGPCARHCFVASARPAPPHRFVYVTLLNQRPSQLQQQQRRVETCSE